MSEQSETIQGRARDLLSEERVDFVIGYETGSDGLNARPYFACAPEEADNLVFDETCTSNLTTYLTDPARRGKKIGVVVKPCDARSLNVLALERQVGGDGVVAIPVGCQGVVQRTREGGDGLKLQDRCAGCSDRVRNTRFSDGSDGADRSDRLEAFERLSPAERDAFWAHEFERCIRCNACRQVCPACYCEECFAESLDPEWVGIRMSARDNWMFHTIRAFHQVGRCVGCDECERVCPVNIPLGLLTGKLRKDVLGTFGFSAGVSPEVIPPLATFNKDEKLGVG